MPESNAGNAARRGALGCIGCFFWLMLLGCLALIPGSIVWAVLVELGRHGHGPLDHDAWVHGGFKSTFTGPVVALLTGIGGFFYVAIEGEDYLKIGKSRSTE